MNTKEISKSQRNIKLLIEYDGTNYHGWQSQNGRAATIQETITKAIKKITGEDITLYGASRTDAGVHALGQVANFYTSTSLSPERLARAINANLPPDIIIKKAEIVPSHFNTRRMARTKTYIYTILNQNLPIAFNRNYFYFLPGKRLILSRMRKAAKYLIGTHDFRAFVTKGSLKQNCIRKIYSLTISKKKINAFPFGFLDKGKKSSCQFIQFKIKGDGFLHKMIRAIVGTLLLVGEGKIPPDEVKKILETGDRKKAGPNVPAKGLCLVKVEY